MSLARVVRSELHFTRIGEQNGWLDKHLSELFLDTLKDIYYAEKKILSTLPKMAKAAQSPDLKAAFEKHENETEGQIERLEQVFEIIGAAARGKKCDAIEGIIDEGRGNVLEYQSRRLSTPDFWQLRMRITKFIVTAR
jgi:ferritin-like metal-binding protein YciE